MGITIKISRALCERGSPARVEVEGRTIGECLDDLIRQYPDTRRWLFGMGGRLRVLVLAREEVISERDLHMPIADGDELYLLSVAYGG